MTSLPDGTAPARRISPHSPPSFRTIRSACCWALQSIQMIPGHRHSPSSAMGRTPSICEEKAMPATSFESMPVFETRRRVVAATPSHQSTGFCSAQPCAGWLMSYGSNPVATRSPAVVVRIALSPPVPASCPITYLSVSYTHLRAHETRHDLVCRLLLEKKKQ